MEDYNPAMMADKKLRAYLNMQSATSGTVPSGDILNRIVEEELNARSRTKYNQQLLALQKMHDAYGIQQQENALKAKRSRGVGMALTSLGTTALTLLGGEK